MNLDLPMPERHWQSDFLLGERAEGQCVSFVFVYGLGAVCAMVNGLQVCLSACRGGAVSPLQFGRVQYELYSLALCGSVPVLLAHSPFGT